MIANFAVLQQLKNQNWQEKKIMCLYRKTLSAGKIFKMPIDNQLIKVDC